MYETVLYEKDNGVANIALNRPEKLNAFDGTMHDQLYSALGSAAEDAGVRCIVVRGEGRGFSAGADLAQVVREADGDPDLGGQLRDGPGERGRGPDLLRPHTGPQRGPRGVLREACAGVHG